MTSPTSGSTVGGTMNVEASVSIVGSLTVADVQFRLDGANLGVPDTTAPYSVPWNTTTANNGSHTLTAVARDLLGVQYTSNPVTVTVSNDTTPPTVAITSPAAGSMVNGTIVIAASASDDVAVAGVQFLADGAAIGGEGTTAPYEVTWDVQPVPEGSHTLTAIARDTSGNTATSAPVTVTVDRTPPTVAITSPADGATVSGTITVAATASDNFSVMVVELRVDGVLRGQDRTAPYELPWDTTTVADGTHTLGVWALDAARNVSTLATVTMTVANAPPADTTPPTVAITSPSDGATVSGTVTVSASASDDVGVVGVRFFVDGEGIGSELATPPYEVAWDTRTVPDGPHRVVAIARDAAGNFTNPAVTVTVANGPPADTTPPTVAITSPSDGATVNGTITIAADASDDVAVAGVQFFVDGLAIGADTTAPFEVGWDSAAVAEGAHTLTAVARDTADNTATSAGVTVTVDRTPPTVAITSPADGATVSGTITVRATASDNFSVMLVELRVDGVLRGEDRTAPYEIPWDTTTVVDGSHTLGVWALDAARNVSTLATVTVTVANEPPADTTPPTVAITSPASGATVSGTVTVGATASDDIGVAGVQVFVDGAPIGAEDTTAPFEVAWDTTTVPDGAHTLTAVARDTSGNTATSAPVAVTVANAAPPAVTRFEETAATLAPEGSWSETSSTGLSVTLSGDRAVFASEPGATATFTFSGTGVSWLGVRCEICGIARVSLDGVAVATVDTFAPPPRSADVLFTTSGLPAGSHTLAIEVTGTANPSSGATFIVVDAFDVTDSAVTPGDTTPPTVSITSPASGATVSGTVIVAASASDNVGVAGVRFFVDGVAILVEDTTAPFEVGWDTTTVPDGSHTLTAVARDTSGNTTTSAPVTVTVANGTSAATRFEEDAATLTPDADWFPISEVTVRGADLSGDRAVIASAAGARATFTFTGTAVSWIGLVCPECGIANVFVDGVQVATLDTFSPTWPAASGPLFTTSGLVAASHTLVIEATFTRNPSATQSFVVVDAFDVTP